MYVIVHDQNDPAPSHQCTEARLPNSPGVFRSPVLRLAAVPMVRPGHVALPQGGLRIDLPRNPGSSQL